MAFAPADKVAKVRDFESIVHDWDPLSAAARPKTDTDTDSGDAEEVGPEPAEVDAGPWRTGVVALNSGTLKNPGVIAGRKMTLNIGLAVVLGYTALHRKDDYCKVLLAYIVPGINFYVFSGEHYVPDANDPTGFSPLPGYRFIGGVRPWFAKRSRMPSPDQ